jgi:hypothetical protein
VNMRWEKGEILVVGDEGRDCRLYENEMTLTLRPFRPLALDIDSMTRGPGAQDTGGINKKDLKTY